MTKANFKRHLRELKKLYEAEDKITEAFRLIGSKDFSSFDLEKPISLIMEVLKDAMDDNYDYISYFVYELEFGKRDMAKDCITEQNGTKISLQTIDQLYNYIEKVKKEHDTKSN